jgi:hypothetical protein
VTEITTIPSSLIASFFIVTSQSHAIKVNENIR